MTNVKIDTSEKALIPLFGNHEATIKKYQEYSLEMEIKDSDSLAVAENNAGCINDMIKAIEGKRKEIKEPYLNAGKEIDLFAKKFLEPLTEIKKKINTEIKNWKVVQAAAARAEAEKAEREANRIAEEKTKEADRITRIQSQLVARLYGGYWFNKENQRKSSAGCQNPKDCDDLKMVIAQSTPPTNSFKRLGKDYNDMISETLAKISKHKAHLIEMQSESSDISITAQQEAEINKARTMSEVNDKRDELKQRIVSEVRSITSKVNKEVQEAGKGIRRNVIFNVVNISEVPEEWLILDGPAVREWAHENKEMIKKAIKENNPIIKGIKFEIEEIHVTR